MNYYRNQGETLFGNRDAFEIDFVPRIFNFRKDQVNPVDITIRQGMQGNRTLNLVKRSGMNAGRDGKVYGYVTGSKMSNYKQK